MDIKTEIIELIKNSLGKTFPQTKDTPLPDIELEYPKDPIHGDFSTNIAMKLAKPLKMPPADIAASLAGELNRDINQGSLIGSIRVEKPGYINFIINEKIYHDFLIEVLADCRKALSRNLGKNEKIQIEFVSANPTGSLSVAHGRQAAVGEALARIFDLFGFKVTREYYLNDEGNQINMLGASIIARIREFKGERLDFPADGYLGEYIKDIAKEIMDGEPSRFEDLSINVDPKLLEFVSEYGLNYILNIIKKELEDFGVKFDVWFSQKALRESGKIDKALESLKDKGLAFDKDGALWFNSTKLGDDKDRVLIKSDGSFTYLAPDIAYHQDKYKRGYERVINIWGPDHHGYIPRMMAAVEALGVERKRLSIIIVQLARIFKAGVPLVMSTRKAQYITLREVMDEVGSDVAKFFFLTRRTDSHLDFDLELAKRQSSENPVYYVQYAHARIAGIIKQSKEKGIKETSISKIDFGLLQEAEELALLRSLYKFQSSLFTALEILDPYPITQYLIGLATEFHKFYDKHKVLVEGNDELANARLGLAKAVGLVLSQGLDLLAIKSPERM